MSSVSRKFWLSSTWVYLLMCLAGLVGGLWPDLLWPNSSDFRPAPLPTLQILAVAQVLFFVLAWPIAEHRQQKPVNLPIQAITTACILLLTMPFYLVAGWLADAALADCMRAGLTVLAFVPLGWVSARLLRVWRLRGPVMLGLIVLVLGLPGAVYFLREFYPQIPLAWLWRISPIGLAWCNAASRELFMLPQPVWAFTFWPVLAGAIFVCSISKEHSNFQKKQCPFL